MKHSLSSQISAIQKARTLLSGSIVAQPVELIEQLNDAASSLACLNMVKALSEEEQIQFFLKTLKTL
jgi:hypothetical protein